MDEKKYKSAEESRGIATKAAKVILYEELDDIFSEIDDVSIEGSFESRFFNQEFSDVAIDFLKAKGYEVVSEKGGINETDTIVRWLE